MLLCFCRYSTGLGVTGGSALIHDFYSREVPNPIQYLSVDTGFTNGEGTIKAHVLSICLLETVRLQHNFKKFLLIFVLDVCIFHEFFIPVFCAFTYTWAFKISILFRETMID
jgi:hypothetical protein